MTNDFYRAYITGFPTSCEVFFGQMIEYVSDRARATAAKSKLTTDMLVTTPNAITRRHARRLHCEATIHRHASRAQVVSESIERVRRSCTRVAARPGCTVAFEVGKEARDGPNTDGLASGINSDKICCAVKTTEGSADDTGGLAEAAQREGVVAPPDGALGRAQLRRAVVARAEAAALAASRGEATELAVLVHRVAEPVDAGISADGLVVRVNADHLIVPVMGRSACCASTLPWEGLQLGRVAHHIAGCLVVLVHLRSHRSN